MISTKAEEILNRVRKHLRDKKSVKPADSQGINKPQAEQVVNQDKTDPLFPNGADSGPEAQLPITGPDQGMLSHRMR